MGQRALSFPAEAAALEEALRHDPFYRALAGALDPARARAAMRRYFDLSMIEAERLGALVRTDPPGRGASLWIKPRAKAAGAAADKRAALEPVLGPGGSRLYARMVDAMEKNLEGLPLSPREPDGSVDFRSAWYLSILGVAPSFQGGGHGTQLVAEGLEAADGAGVATYLETFGALRPDQQPYALFLRCGYRPVESFQEPHTRSSYTVMVRLPHARSQRRRRS
ncbi:MAG: GNAT family N-acetyltransferase [Acidobacteriota bacterium]